MQRWKTLQKVLIELEKVKDRPNKELVVLVGKGFIESGC